MKHAGCLTGLICLIAAGCSEKVSGIPPAPAPRPVTAFKLAVTDPAQSRRVTASVGSWKTEQIGFEVSGRVKFVAEPETDVEPQTEVDDREATVLASLDDARYHIQKDSARAQMDVASRKKDAVQIEADEVIPAQRAAAQAKVELTTAEFNRVKPLAEKKIASQAELDQATANLKTALAELAQTEATQLAKKAEVTSLEAQIRQAEAAVLDAQRNVTECVLRAPFRGQVATVHVIPGGFVQAGQPIVTVQMMDPIKVDFEVSADHARKLRYKDEVSVVITRGDGSEHREEGIVYLTDTMADSATRTFTVTVLLRNRKVGPPLPAEVPPETPRTHDTWRLLKGVVDASSRLYVAKTAIHRDADGEFLWKIVSRSGGSPSGTALLLNVDKLRITSGPREASFLGLWTFQEVTVTPEQDFDPQTGFITDRIELPEGVTDWSGGRVVLEREQWLLRPGDLVGVDLPGQTAPAGLYVPLNALLKDGGSTSVFVIEGHANAGVARRKMVRVQETVGSLMRIEPVESGAVTAGMLIVSSAVHSLPDGEQVVVASQEEDRP